MNNTTARQLLHEQLDCWELARANYHALEQVQTKHFRIDGCEVRVQFNPARIRSTAAKVDPKSLQQRACFLCPANLPAEQRSLPMGKDYLLLVNPFPIFPVHFTLPCTSHTPQSIGERYEDMLDAARCLDDFTVFYNGPKCGASAPDHMHFQAGSKGFLPLEQDVKDQPKKLVLSSPEGMIYTLPHYLRSVFVLCSDQKTWLCRQFKSICNLLEVKDGEHEPMLNLVTWHDGSQWVSCVFPRKAHRPQCFFAEGEKNLLISPASVDMGGVFITPQEKDFLKITEEDIRHILQEVCLNQEEMEAIVQLTANS